MAGKGGTPRAPSFREMNLDFWLKGGGKGVGVGRGRRKWGKEGGLEGRFEGEFGQVQGSLERWEGRGRWGRGEGGGGQGGVQGGREEGKGQGRQVRVQSSSSSSWSWWDCEGKRGFFERISDGSWWGREREISSRPLLTQVNTQTSFKRDILKRKNLHSIMLKTSKDV